MVEPHDSVALNPPVNLPVGVVIPEPHTTLLRAIQISVDAVDETARKHYLALAVSLEDMAAAPLGATVHLGSG